MHLPWRDVPLTPDGPPVPTSILAEEIAELQRLADGAVVLEVGSAFGFSAIGMALGGAKQIVAVDPHGAHGSHAAMLANADAYGVTGQLEVVTERSDILLPRLPDDMFDLAFIDGDHTEPGCRYDITQALRLVKPGGHIAVHDYLEDCCCPGVRVAFDAMFRQVPESWYGTVTGTMFVVEVPA